MEMKLTGDIAYFVAIVGINLMFFFMLMLTKWRRDFLSITWTTFFFIVALILDLSATILFVPEWREFVIGYVRTPVYLALAASVWTLLFASLVTAAAGKKRRGQAKVDVAPLEK